MTFMRRILIFFLFFTGCFSVQCQDLDDVAEFIKEPEVDSAYVDLNDNRWTLRLFSAIKYQSFSLKNNNGRVFYRPTQPVSGGIGASYRTLLLDLGIRFSNGGSQRFDLQTSLLVRSYFISLNIQNYEGFEETDPEEFDNFREDIRTFTVNLDVTRLPNHREISFRSIQSGIDRQKKGSGSILYGGFIGFHEMNADSSIIPPYAQNNFNEEYGLDKLLVRNIGVLAGYVHIHPLSEIMFVIGSIRPGIGLQWGQTSSGISEEKIPGALFTKMSFIVGTGFNWDRFYASAVYNVEASYVNLGDNHIYNYNSGKLKAVIGYKL